MIKENDVVAINYTLTDEEGKLLDSSDGEPMEFLQGHQNIIPGLEKELTGLNVGDKKKVVVPPEQGYGHYNPELQFELPIEQFGQEQPQTGMMLQLSSNTGESFMAKIIRVQNDRVIMDANHPLAGKSLHFDVEITAVREATPDELTHGHPHGPNGHHH
jgi:FKBP-type peptidyl-prolyl cis-trans isomerase SlyD